MGIGILGIGVFLPPEVRHNHWWPPELVASWRRRPRATPPALPMTPAMKRVLAAMVEAKEDPFRGVITRHVMDASTTSTDMEERAAREALSRAGVAASQIDLLMVHTAVPEYLLSNTACALHYRLALPATCLALEAQASAYSFLAQLALAEAMIASGRAHHALLVQSSAASRLVDHTDPVSVALGDAATAVVVGHVPDGRGLIAHVSRADGRCPDSLIASVRDKRWYDGGRIVLSVRDAPGEQRLFLETADRGREVVRAALDAAQLEPDEIDFFAVHQGTPWLRRITQEVCALKRARTVDLFARTGYVFAASIPLVLATGEREGLLADDDLVVAFGGGTGITYGAAVMRWSCA